MARKKQVFRMCIIVFLILVGLNYMNKTTSESCLYKYFKSKKYLCRKDVSSNTLSTESEKQGLNLTNSPKYEQAYKSYILHYIDKLNVTVKRKTFMKTELKSGGADAKEIMQTIALESRNKTIEIINKEFQQRLPGGMIIGCKKCGTGFLSKVVERHSGVAFRRPREVHFFDNYENYTNPSYRHFEAYRLQMTYSFPDQLTMEKTPKYWVTPSAPQEIHNMNPNIKLLLLVREPACRMVSDYYHTIVRQMGPFNLTAKFSDIVTKPEFNRVFDYLIQPSFYDVHLRNWLKTFPLQQIMVIRNEDLSTSKLPKILFDVEEYLGLNHEFDVTFSPKKMCILTRSSAERHKRCFPPDETGACKYDSEHGHTLQNLRKVLKPHAVNFEKMVNRTFDWF